MSKMFSVQADHDAALIAENHKLTAIIETASALGESWDDTWDEDEQKSQISCFSDFSWTAATSDSREELELLVKDIDVTSVEFLKAKYEANLEAVKSLEKQCKNQDSTDLNLIAKLWEFSYQSMFKLWDMLAAPGHSNIGLIASINLELRYAFNGSKIFLNPTSSNFYYEFVACQEQPPQSVETYGIAPDILVTCEAEDWHFCDFYDCQDYD